MDNIHLTEEQFHCFSQLAKNPKYAGKGFVEDTTFKYPSWEELVTESVTNCRPYFVWCSIGGWLGALKLGLDELQCPEAQQLYSSIQQAFNHCLSVREAQQSFRYQRRNDSNRVISFIYFMSLGKGMFQIRLDSPDERTSSDLHLSCVHRRWGANMKELNSRPDLRDGIFQSKVEKLTAEAKQVNRVGPAWSKQLPSMAHLVQLIRCEEKEGTSQRKELLLGLEKEIQRAISSCLIVTQKKSGFYKYENKLRLRLEDFSHM
ncbi:uncharacterized protein [Dysidea avara]|uniref:uncharacterized protein isoform X2 n=1 Tax=Dysidea avara TaxID=196820 RepID=UPI00331E6D45